jgi:hypothetical protein
MRKYLIFSFAILILISFALAYSSFYYEKWETLTASISLIIAIISGWIAYETFYRQTLSNKPQIILRLDFRSRYDLVLLVAENLGAKPAFNIRFQWNKDLLNHNGEKVTFNKSKTQPEIPVLNPKESTSIIIGTPSSIYDKNKGDNLDYTGMIMFQETLNSKRKSSYPFLFSFEHYRLSPLSETEEPKTMYELQKIPDKLDQIKSQLVSITKTIQNLSTDKKEDKQL